MLGSNASAMGMPVVGVGQLSSQIQTQGMNVAALVDVDELERRSLSRVTGHSQDK